MEILDYHTAKQFDLTNYEILLVAIMFSDHENLQVI